MFFFIKLSVKVIAINSVKPLKAMKPEFAARGLIHFEKLLSQKIKQAIEGVCYLKETLAKSIFRHVAPDWNEYQ
jgi:hypothetical protein